MSQESYSVGPDRSAEHVVALSEDSSRTLGALYGDAAHVAALLPTAVEVGGERSLVLLACADRYLFAVGLLAAWLRGHAVALPPSHREKVLQELCESAGVLTIVHDGEAEGGVDLREILVKGSGTAVSTLPLIDAQAHVVTLFTSGSTGAPVPAMKRAHQLLGEVEVLAAEFGESISRVLCTLPPRHIYGLLFGLLLPLRAGAAFVRETPLHTDTILEFVRTFKIDTLVAVPAHLKGLETAALDSLFGLRRVFSSGAPLPTATFETLSDELGLSVTEVLGSTETGGIGFRTAPSEPYRPFAEVIVEEGDEAQLLLRSPRLASDIPQPFACDDRIELLPSGAFNHLGRSGDVVKVGGTRVALGAIEQRVRALPGVTDAAALARSIPGARGQEILLAVAGEGWDTARMRAALSETLDPVALPRRYRFLSSLPREATGKLRRDSVLAMFEGPRTKADFDWGRRELEGDHLRAELMVPAGLLYFSGHFEAWPVLPGVAQLGLIAVREALATWPDLHALRRVHRLKFKRPIEPEQALVLELDRLPGLRVDFSIHHEGELCSTGSLLFEAKDS